MQSLSLTTATTTSNTSNFIFSIPCYKNRRIYRNLPFRYNRHRKFALFVAKDEDKFDSWEQMELKFGKMIGEDPKLTLAKECGDVLELQKIGQESDELTATSSMHMSLDTALRRPPKRLDQSVKDTSKIEKVVSINPNPTIETENLPTTPFLKEREDTDWKRAENLIKTEGKEEVELINSSTRGFVHLSVL